MVIGYGLTLIPFWHWAQHLLATPIVLWADGRFLKKP